MRQSRLACIGFSDNPIYQGLYAYYSLNSDASDSSGNSRNGTIYGATNVAGKVGNCYNFDGVDDYIIAPFGFGNTPITVAYWMYMANQQACSQVSAGTDGNCLNCAMFYSNGNCYFDYGTLSNRLAFANPTGYFNQWVHVVCTSGEGNARVYFNGVMVGGHTSPGVITPLSNVYIGRVDPITEINLYQTGRLDEVGIWNRVLTADEIAYLYNSGNGRAL